MCRIPKVLIVAPPERHQDLRKALSSLEYDIAATVSSVDEAAGVGADVAVAWEPDEDTLLRLRELSFKTVAVGGGGDSADMKLEPDDVASFKSRIWELFRPA
jgi:prolyl-tRNA editing enzyme YbaK/EbsC (Cys-tRNA(Pro) deacylase)